MITFLLSSEQGFLFLSACLLLHRGLEHTISVSREKTQLQDEFINSTGDYNVPPR